MAKIRDSITWFKNEFADDIQAGMVNLPFSVDLLAAIAIQESGYIWGTLAARGMPRDEVLTLCAGDTFDYPNRQAFPSTKAELLEFPKGSQMFVIAREALEAVGSQIIGYASVASDPDKYCHGFGIFQYDLQHFKSGETQYFLEKEWYNFSSCLQQCLKELNRALLHTYGPAKKVLTDQEMVYVAIAYNCGHAKTAKDFKQGFHSGDGRYYGESICNYLQIAHEVC